MTTLGDLGEFGLINRIARNVSPAPNVIEGIGDDCAVLRLGDRLLLASCDLSIEDVHFRRHLTSAGVIGWRAAASSLSDIAAMGGVPRFVLVALACPANTESGFVEALYAGLLDAISRSGAALVGGDTTRSVDRIVIDVTVLGEVVGNRHLSRKGAQPGDILAVTGSPGLSSAGLRALEQGDDAPALVHAHCHPVPRIAEGQWLCARPQVHAMIDISDGLMQDAGHLGEAADLGVDIDPARLPVPPDLAGYCKACGLDPHDFILAGGEDYELAFAMEPGAVETILDEFRRAFDTPIQPVGVFTDACRDVRVAGRNVGRKGFDHFHR